MFGSGPTFAFKNEILAGTPLSELEALRPYLAHTRLVARQSLYEPGHPIDHVYFVEHGLVSVMTLVAEGGDHVEVGLIGPEGMAGLPTLFGPEATMFNSVMVQIAGESWRLPKHILHEYLPHSPVLRRNLYQAFEVFFAQVSQTAACNSQHTLSHRLAGWLLTVRERVKTDDLALRQDLLSIMLGVSRPAITIAMSKLTSKGFVKQTRGHVTILDQEGLETVACGCFARVRDFAQTVLERRSPGLTVMTHPAPALVELPASASREDAVERRASSGYHIGRLPK